MAEATQYKFGLTELTTLLVKQQNIHEGRWMVVMELTFGASLMGVTADVSYPTALIQIPAVVLSRAPDGLLEGTPGLVDAAVVNPPNKGRAKA